MLKNSFLKELGLFLRVLPFGLIVFAVYAIIEWCKFSYILSNQKRFLLDTVMVFADSFLINAVGIIMMPVLLLQSPPNKNIFSVFLSSFSTLPKIILSYFFLMILTQFSFEVSQSSPIPALIVLVLFIWAPYFVSMEQFADQHIAEKEVDEDDFNSLDPFDDGGFVEKPRTFFAQKQPWRIGFGRSIEFTSKNSSLALSIVFVIWLVRVIPELIVGLTLDTNKSFDALLIQSAISVLGAILVNLAIFRTIFKGLEPTQRIELLHAFGPEMKEQMNPIVVSTPNGARITVLCLLVIFTTAIWSEKRIQVGSFPSHAKIVVRDYQERTKEIVVKFELTDEETSFRWFNPERFRFYQINPADKESKTAAPNEGAKTLDQSAEGAPKEKTPNTSLERLVTLLKEKLINPSRAVVYNTENKVLQPFEYAPRSGTLKLVIAFPVKTSKEDADSKNHTGKDLYEISYLNQFGLKQVLLTFSKESGPSLIGREIPHD